MVLGTGISVAKQCNCKTQLHRLETSIPTVPVAIINWIWCSSFLPVSHNQNQWESWQEVARSKPAGIKRLLVDGSGKKRSVKVQKMACRGYKDARAQCKSECRMVWVGIWEEWHYSVRVIKDVRQVREGVQGCKSVHEVWGSHGKDQEGHVRLCICSVSGKGLGESAWMGKTYSNVTFPVGFPYDFLGCHMAITWLWRSWMARTPGTSHKLHLFSTIITMMLNKRS